MANADKGRGNNQQPYSVFELGNDRDNKSEGNYNYSNLFKRMR